MSNKKILIAYGTRYGSTEEISQRIAEVLESKGLTTQLIDLKTTQERDWLALGRMLVAKFPFLTYCLKSL
ncbi:hypothetical protein ISS96_00625 [Candidatus Bathyarchaeota archaeon]|nr:hypothetical protein [Candidatus Bathyarchaeota archaeon]